MPPRLRDFTEVSTGELHWTPARPRNSRVGLSPGRPSRAWSVTPPRCGRSTSARSTPHRCTACPSGSTSPLRTRPVRTGCRPATLAEAEDAVRTAVEALGGAYVGRVAGQGRCRYTAHLPARAAGGRGSPIFPVPRCGPSTTRTGPTSATPSRPTSASTGCSPTGTRWALLAAEGDPLDAARAVAHVAVFADAGPGRAGRGATAGGRLRGRVEPDGRGRLRADRGAERPGCAATRARPHLGRAGDRRAPRRHLRRLDLRRRGLRSPTPRLPSASPVLALRGLV